MESVRCVTNRDCSDKTGSYTVRTATASKKALKIGLGLCRKDEAYEAQLDKSRGQGSLVDGVVRSGLNHNCREEDDLWQY